MWSPSALGLLQPLLQRPGTKGDFRTLPENDVSVLIRQETPELGLRIRRLGVRISPGAHRTARSEGQRFGRIVLDGGATAQEGHNSPRRDTAVSRAPRAASDLRRVTGL
jgi:hypothetical protein